MSKQKIAIGPEMPDVPTMSADAAAANETETPASSEVETVSSTDAFGNVVETIVSVAAPKNETREQLAARVRESYTDANGNLIETY